MKKILKAILPIFSLVALYLLSGCSSHNLASEDVLERADSSNRITWGVKADQRLFGLLNIATGEIEGFDVDIAKAVTKEILGEDGQAEFVEVTSKTRIPLLKNGNIDAVIATMTITEERKKIVDFSDSYFEAGQSLLVEKDSSIQSIDDLDASTTVLVVKGSTSAKNIREMAPEANVLEMENMAEAFTALKAGQGDAFTTDNAILYGMIAEDPNYTVVGGTFTNEPYGIAVNKGQEDFLNAINEALDTIWENGTYQEIYDKWFGDVDNS